MAGAQIAVSPPSNPEAMPATTCPDRSQRSGRKGGDQTRLETPDKQELLEVLDDEERMRACLLAVDRALKEADSQLVDLAKRCLAFESKDRPQDASAASKEVRAYLET